MLMLVAAAACAVAHIWGPSNAKRAVMQALCREHGMHTTPHLHGTEGTAAVHVSSCFIYIYTHYKDNGLSMTVQRAEPCSHKYSMVCLSPLGMPLPLSAGCWCHLW